MENAKQKFEKARLNFLHNRIKQLEEDNMELMEKHSNEQKFSHLLLSGLVIVSGCFALYVLLDVLA